MATDKKYKLQLQQLDKKLRSFKYMQDTGIPASGWLDAVREYIKALRKADAGDFTNLTVFATS